MTAAPTLAAIARGERPAELLQTCRLATDAGEAYGMEAVSAHFRAEPLSIEREWSAGANVAAVAGDTMLFADAVGDHVMRIWRVGTPGPVIAETRVDVAFDPDMAQARGDVFVSPSDLPDIGGEALARIADAARAALGSNALGPAASRRRLFLLRVAGDAALFAHHALAMGERADAGFRYAALLLDGSEARWFATPPLDRPWTPRV